jgi:hypothetical protein
MNTYLRSLGEVAYWHVASSEAVHLLAPDGGDHEHVASGERANVLARLTCAIAHDVMDDHPIDEWRAIITGTRVLHAWPLTDGAATFPGDDAGTGWARVPDTFTESNRSRKRVTRGKRGTSTRVERHGRPLMRHTGADDGFRWMGDIRGDGYVSPAMLTRWADIAYHDDPAFPQLIGSESRAWSEALPADVAARIDPRDVTSHHACTADMRPMSTGNWPDCGRIRSPMPFCGLAVPNVTQ